MGISDLPTWVTRDAGPRVLADSAAGLPAKKLRHVQFFALGENGVNCGLSFEIRMKRS
jgi:hypothetical protein